MQPAKAVFLKTYGKQMRKISAWISPEDHKRAFDSSFSTEEDVSLLKPPASKREKRTSVACHRSGRRAKDNALLCLREKSSNEENIISSPPGPEAAQQSKATRGKKTTCNRANVLRAKRKAVLQVMESSSDEENIVRPSPPRPPLTQQSKTTGRSQSDSSTGDLSKRTKKDPTVNAKMKKSPLKKKKSSNVHSAGQFVTCRNRQTKTARSRLPRAMESILDSSEDFASGHQGHVHTTQKSTTTRQKIPSSFLVSSVEKSKTSFCFANNPLQEISLNESEQNRLRKFTGNPIFCSTPSAGSLCSRPALKSFSIIDKSISPSSIASSSLQVDQDSHKHPVSPAAIPPTATGLLSSPEGQAPPLPHFKELSCDLFMDYKSTSQKSSSSSDKDISYREDIKTNNDETLPSVILVSGDCESSSAFVSAAGGLEWLIEVLKEKCLTNHCTVQLQRLENINVTRLDQTTYISCLGLSEDGQETGCSPSSVEHIQTPALDSSVFTHNTNTEDDSNLLNDLESVGEADLFKDHSASVESLQSAACHTEISAQIPDSNLDAAATDVRSPQLEDKWLLKKCSVRLKRLDFSKLTAGRHIVNEKYLPCNNRAVGALDAPAGLGVMLKESCTSRQLKVKLTRLSASLMNGGMKKIGHKLVSKSAGDEQSQSSQQSDSKHVRHKDISNNTKRKNPGSTTSEDNTSSGSTMTEVPSKRKKTTHGPKEKRKSMSKDRPGTTRKACVSGLSVSRWKNNSSINKRPWGGNTSTVDCSMNELMSRKHIPKNHGIMNFSTPVRTSQHNISSLLANLTPNTSTWSRLKAALSVHRKVLLSPMNLHLSDTPQRSTLANVSLDMFATPFKSLLSKAPESQQKQISMLCEDTDLSDAEKVYSECCQEQPLAWEECIVPHRMKRSVKIGEGTFGEVFSTVNEFGETVALKVIPIEGSEKVNGEDQKTFGEILHEIIISKELSCLKDKKNNQTHGFIGLHDLHCVRGCYPGHFLKAWDKFDQKRGSENDRPDFFENDQLFLILEFEFGGVDLENSNGTLASLGVAKSILHQVTAALAVAEEELHFEHRDLHWGNILVKATKQKTGNFMLNGDVHSVETQGVLVRIIDNSLSRLAIDNLIVSCDISDDEELFLGQGDYQFEIYRLMRQENGNNWSDYHPHSNVLWLHYLCSKLLSMKYKRGGRGVKEVRVELNHFFDNVLDYSSATEVLRKCPMFQ